MEPSCRITNLGYDASHRVTRQTCICVWLEGEGIKPGFFLAHGTRLGLYPRSRDEGKPRTAVDEKEKG